ncbi:hypothetical protein C8Q79DRAFT_945109 [Trametes meyenii]|nr:hypothetical protein C8Q79DRAFT_945109 [Trametes meyenii]
MNGRLLRQALFSPSEPESGSPLRRPVSAFVEGTVGSANVRYGESEAIQGALRLNFEHSMRNFPGSLSPRMPEGLQDNVRTINTTQSTQLLSSISTRIPSPALGYGVPALENPPEVARSPIRLRKSRAFSQTRPAKTLRQRTSPDDEHDPPPYPGVVASDDVEVPFVLNPHRPEDSVPRMQSRSGSVLSSAIGRQDDDISSVMMRGATDLRNAKFQLEEQRREIAALKAQVVSTRVEKEETLQRLKAVKEAARQSLQQSCTSLEAMRLSVEGLKTQSETSFTVLGEARSSLADVTELREVITSSMQGIAPYVEGGEEWAKSREMKALMRTLELDCTKSHQVADLLRDRLQSVGGELIEAKNRAAELETAQGEDRDALCRANATVISTTQEVMSLAAYVKKQQGELHDTLALAADVTAKLDASHQRIDELQALIRGKDAELKELGVVRGKVTELQALIARKETYIAQLKDVQNELIELKTILAKKEARVEELTATNISQEATIREQRIKVQQLEEKLEEMRTEIHSFKEDIGASREREQTLRVNIQTLYSEKDAQAQTVASLEETLAASRQELDARLERLREANSRCQALEDRFEDQSITLRITREAAGDAQERLLLAETSHTKRLSEVAAKLETEIAVLQEQKLGLKANIDVMDAALERQEQATRSLQQEHTDRLKEIGEAHATRLEQEEKHIRQLIDDLTDSRARTSSSESNVSRLEEELRDLRVQLKEAQLPPPQLEADLRTLRSRVTSLEASELKSALRAKTIESRYRTGDLNDEEKAFINTLVRTSAAIHEQELVANRNELRRRDNTLKEMRAKIHLLESTLARHVVVPKSRPAPEAVGAHSLIDPTAWMSSSGHSSSPTQAPDRDGQPNVDGAAPVKSTTAADHVQQISSSVHTSTINAATMVREGEPQQNKAPAGKTPPTTRIAIPGPTRRANFSRLATDCSDEILDFDDGSATTRKLSPLSSLGKRSKPNSPRQPVEGDVASKPLKRLRTARKAETTGNYKANDMTTKKPIQPSSSKNRARKRR